MRSEVIEVRVLLELNGRLEWEQSIFVRDLSRINDNIAPIWGNSLNLNKSTKIKISCPTTQALISYLCALFSNQHSFPSLLANVQYWRLLKNISRKVSILRTEKNKYFFFSGNFQNAMLETNSLQHFIQVYINICMCMCWKWTCYKKYISCSNIKSEKQFKLMASGVLSLHTFSAFVCVLEYSQSLGATCSTTES